MIANASSTCASVPAGTTNSGWPRDRAADCKLSTCGGVDPAFGLTTNAIKPGFGKASRRRPKRFGPSSVPKELTPVAFPPGRLRLRSEEHTSELQSLRHLVCRLLLEKKKK